jgi:RNA recognition motif-containing protein
LTLFTDEKTARGGKQTKTLSLGQVMGKKLYIGNLPFATTEDDLAAKFTQYGTVESVKVITDRDTGRSKGFGFIEMASNSEAQDAIDKLNGTDYQGRPMTVSEARPQRKSPGAGRRGNYATRL